jgi:hypothetical protein
MQYISVYYISKQRIPEIYGKTAFWWNVWEISSASREAV